MPEDSTKNFDEIKPFIRMLEGSIEEARARRLAREGGPAEPEKPPVDRAEEAPAASSDERERNRPSESAENGGDGSSDQLLRLRARAMPKARKAKPMSPENRISSSFARPNYRI